METRPIRFEFHCEEGVDELKFIHNIPSSLVNPEALTAQRDSEYGSLFLSAIQPILKEHEAACRAASKRFCENCGQFSVGVLQTPMSWLHNVDDPFVAVLVHPVCGKRECEAEVRQSVDEMITETMAEGRGQGATLSSVHAGNTSCRICGKTERIMKCARCKSAAYCGREHQRADWKVHKTSCVSNDGRGR
jgi:hypothetical protein